MLLERIVLLVVKLSVASMNQASRITGFMELEFTLHKIKLNVAFFL